MEDYEKKYKETVKSIKKLSDRFNDYNLTNELEAIFPELKESEDENIRKEIIKYFKKYRALSLGVYNVQDILAWLEKQGEQKPADKVEPKFKVGDWIICRNGEDALYQITDSIPTGYMIKGDDGIIHSVTFEQLVNCNATLCVIQNQKPAWSEKDEDILKQCLYFFNGGKGGISDNRREEILNWLKSLKDRYTWKPSKEQVEALKESIDEHFDIDGGGIYMKF